jgi:hypothetical protein
MFANANLTIISFDSNHELINLKLPEINKLTIPQFYQFRKSSNRVQLYRHPPNHQFSQPQKTSLFTLFYTFCILLKHWRLLHYPSLHRINYQNNIKQAL